MALTGASSTREGDHGDDEISAIGGAMKRSREALEADTVSGAHTGGSSRGVQRTSQGAKGSLQGASIKASIQKQAIAEATRELTRLFIQCAIPFHVLCTPKWKSAMRVVSCIGCE